MKAAYALAIGSTQPEKQNSVALMRTEREFW